MFSSILRLGIILPAFIMAVLATPVQLNRRDISSKLLDDFSLHAQFAFLARCDQNINGTRGKLSCDQGPCDLVQAHDTEIIDNYHRIDNATGYIALDHTRKSIIVTFRGTVSNADGEADQHFLTTYVPEFCEKCQVHQGFWAYWKSAEEQVVSRLEQATKENPDYSIAVAGHSLGGAVATLAGTALRQKGFTLDIWTFGSPQVGSIELAQFITEQRKPVSVYRATNYRDGIPALPGRLLGYRHPSPEFWINQTSGHKVTTDVVKVIEGIENTSGNQDHHDWGYNANHDWYFGTVNICAESVDQGK
ncbi:unnamed protein product [Penicillium salamii]|nr:unnamed protein product [Penicillium salamii]